MFQSGTPTSTDAGECPRASYITLCNTQQNTAIHGETPQHTATYCNTLPHAATQMVNTGRNLRECGMLSAISGEQAIVKKARVSKPFEASLQVKHVTHMNGSWPTHKYIGCSHRKAPLQMTVACVCLWMSIHVYIFI